ncbi:hypothetical protein GCM10023311_21820 [Flaviramulus aquimarinus]|uniref:Thioredoxin domain-containing protein n=2 Tax=Flaviramulus aquimarinus TaxID=1170456 RepID=A0ABP9F8I8_9FLAO
MFFFGQIKVSEHIQPSAIAKQNDNALYFVDFWATWCKPCIHVSKYLESLQKQYSNNFYVLSLTKENPDLVKRFVLKHKTDLAIAIDYDGETFKNNSIRSLPHGVLYNADGEKLWEGHPADFKGHQIVGFLNRNKKQVSVNKMFKVQAYEKSVVVKDVGLKKDFEIIKLNAKENTGSLQVVKHLSYLDLKGSLQDILAYTMDSFKNQVNLSEELNKRYQMRFKFGSDAYSNKTETILKALRLKGKSTEVHGEALVFDIKTSTFWDTEQIDWGKDTQHFLIGDSEIQADNVTLNQITYQLANLLKTPIVLVNNDIDEHIHDWNVHYKYFDLMVSSLSDNYGIQVEKKMVNYPQYIITKKAPF